jgi:phosphatidylglycerophosphate synthase/diacylglycerol kinase family enzyme
MVLTNIITLFRVIALPLIIYLHLQFTPLASFWALIVMLLAIFSDLLDNALARHKGNYKIGSFLDPFTDKILVLGLLLTLTLQGLFSYQILLFYIIRDIIVALVRLFAGREDVPLSNLIYGKLLIVTQYLIILSIIFTQFITLNNHASLPFLNPTTLALIILSLIITLTSIFHSIYTYRLALKKRTKNGKKIEKEELSILANRKSRGYQNNYRRHLLRIFARRRKAPIIFLPKTKNMFKGIEKQLKKANHIIIAGGDGSFESALNYKPLAKKSLGFFPLGAGNAFYSYFYKGKRFEYLRSRFSFYETKLDIFEIEWDKGTRQTAFLALGIDAEVMRRGSQRTQHGFRDYIKASWKALLNSNASYNLVCTIDGKKHLWKNCVNMIIGKIPYYGFGVRSLIGRVTPDDNNVYALVCINSHAQIFNKALRLWAIALSIFSIDKPPLLSLKGKKFQITSKIPFPIHAGGEFLGFTRKLNIRVIRKQKVLMI